MLTAQDASFQKAGAWTSTLLSSNECWQIRAENCFRRKYFHNHTFATQPFFCSIIFLPSSYSQNEQKYVYSRGGEAKRRAETQLSQQHTSTSWWVTPSIPAWLSECFEVITAHRKGNRSTVNILHSTIGTNKQCWMVSGAQILEPQVGPWSPDPFPLLVPTSYNQPAASSRSR